MPRRAREEQDDEDDGLSFDSRYDPPYNNANTDDDYDGASLFSQTLAKQARAHVEVHNGHLRDQILAVDPENTPLSDDGVPTYHYWNVVAEYRRAMLEVDLRFSGTVGTVHVWGDNDMYQQGLPRLLMDDEQQTDNFEPHPLGKRLKGIRQIRGGGTMSAVLDVHGVPYSWGSSDQGALGRTCQPGMEEDAYQATPLPITGFTAADGRNEDGTVTQLACGAAHIVYLTQSGNVYATGFMKDSDSGMWRVPDPRVARHGDDRGILGGHETPVQVVALQDKDIISVHAAEGFCAAMTADRDLYTWGFGNQGELARSRGMVAPNEEGKLDVTTSSYIDKAGDGDKDYQFVLEKFLTPQLVMWQVPGPKRKVMNVACGSFHLLVAALEEGQNRVLLYSSGLNQYGQLGNGDSPNSRHALTKVPFFEEQNLIVGQVAAGNQHSMALTADGTAVYAWGRSDYSALGIGREATTVAGMFFDTPQRTHTPKGLLWKRIATGDHTSMALTVDGDLYTWGFGDVTGHGGKYLDGKDCVVPRRLEVGDMVVHDIDGGAQHGLCLASRKPKDASPPAKPQAKRRKMN